MGSNPETFPSCLKNLEIHQPCLTARKQNKAGGTPLLPVFWQCCPPSEWNCSYSLIGPGWFVKLLWVFKWTVANGVSSFLLRLKISWSTRSGAGRTARSWSECTSWRVRAHSHLELCSACSQQGLASALTCLPEWHSMGISSKGLSALLLCFYSVCRCLYSKSVYWQIHLWQWRYSQQCMYLFALAYCSWSTVVIIVSDLYMECFSFYSCPKMTWQP